MKPLKLQEIATIVDGKLGGDPELVIQDADIIRDAQVGFITFAEKKDYFSKVRDSEASAVLIPVPLVDEFQSDSALPYIAVENVVAAFTKIVSLFRPPLVSHHTGVSDAAHVDSSATIGKDVVIEAGAIIGPNVSIGDRCKIRSGANVMSGTQIGADTELYPNVVLYENTKVGERCRLHANCVIGCYGFGYESSTGTHYLSTQLGNVVIEDEVDIGAGSSIDRATFGSTTIGEGTKIDNQVQIGHNCRIGKRNLICALVGIAGSCTTGDNVVMAGQVGIGDHINIGHRVILGAKAGVMADIPDDQVFVGIPATPAKQQMTIIAATHRLPEMRKRLSRLERQMQKDADKGGEEPPKSVYDAA